LIGIIIAVFQDFKRREIDNWLNLFLLFSSFFYLILISFTSKNFDIIFIFALTLFIMYFISHALYYGRIFAGGDAKLLYALTAFFVAGSFFSSLANIVMFLFLLMISGSIYGLAYSFLVYFKNFKKVNKELSKGFENLWIRYSIALGVLFFILGYFNFIFSVLSLFLIVFPLLFIFAKSLEKVSFTKSVSGKDLREGDWLAHDVKVGRRTIKYNFEGLTKDDLRILKNKKNVLIKEGMPFAFAFLMAFLAYVFLREWVMGFLTILF